MRSASPQPATSATSELFFNGIHAATGGYAHPPVPLAAFGQLSLQRTQDRRQATEASRWRAAKLNPDLGPREGIDPKDLAAAGWGVVFAVGADPAVREALAPLLAHRRQQATRLAEHHYRELADADGYQAGESKLAFLARHGVGPGPADPRRMPYYLLLVGGPEEIPFGFQAQLGVQYAVGRLHFDHPEAYHRYALNVVATETSAQARGRAAFFGVETPGDPATELSASCLVEPLADFVAADQPSWRVERVIGPGATKERLSHLLGGDDTPDLLFTASHGLELDPGDPRQAHRQGALVCQDYPGPRAWRGPVRDAHIFSGEDLATSAQARGLIACHFACYGGGTPRHDPFVYPPGPPREIASRPFVAALPQRLLSLPAGALAVVGHVERAWGYSFLWRGVGAQTQVFEDACKRLLEGHPLGSALEPFSLRYAELAAGLADEQEQAEFGTGSPDPQHLPGLWTAVHDARNYVVLGDPAVRLPPLPAAHLLAPEIP